jgi:hypothetical protein
MFTEPEERLHLQHRPVRLDGQHGEVDVIDAASGITSASGVERIQVRQMLRIDTHDEPPFLTWLMNFSPSLTVVRSLSPIVWNAPSFSMTSRSREASTPSACFRSDRV